MPYSTDEIRLINQTTTKFYSEVEASFSATRQHEWEGWNKCLPYLKDAKTILDLGCGNRRFSKFLTDANCHLSTRASWQLGYPNCHIDNVDNKAWDDKVLQVDIIEALLNDDLNLKKYDVAVCFGLMHHVPSAELRQKLLDELVKCCDVAIVSFWQFEKDERIFKKAQETTKIAQEKLGLQTLEEDDYFLGWQDRTDTFRFCHNFKDEEINKIKLRYNCQSDFCTDGGSDRLNRYVVLN